MSAAVVGGGFGVDQDAADVGVLQPEFAFEVSDDLVNASHGELVRQGAVAVDLNGEASAGVAARDGDLVDVENVRAGAGGLAELRFEVDRGADRGTRSDRHGFTFDVGK